MANSACNVPFNNGLEALLAKGDLRGVGGDKVIGISIANLHISVTIPLAVDDDLGLT